jgi:Arc/MetJ family transcription regulator
VTTNIDIDQEKLPSIMELMKFKSKKEAVNKALEEYLRILAARELLKMRGTNCWEGDLDQMRID